MAGNAGYSTDSGGTSQNTIKSVEHNAKQKLKKTKTEYTENKELANDSANADGTEDSTIIPLRYPYTKIDEHDDYMKIDIKEFRPPGLGLNEGSANLALKNSDDAQALEENRYTITAIQIRIITKN